MTPLRQCAQCAGGYIGGARAQTGHEELVVTTDRKDSDKTTPQTFDGETGKPDIPHRRIDLSNLRDVRLELASLYRQVDAGDMESTEANKRAWLLRQIHDVLVSAELERRIIELEEQTINGRLGDHGGLLQAIN